MGVRYKAAEIPARVLGLTGRTANAVCGGGEEEAWEGLCFSHRTFILNQFLRLSVSSVFTNTTVQDRPITVQDRKTQRKYASSLAPADVSVGRKFHSSSDLNRSF